MSLRPAVRQLLERHHVQFTTLAHPAGYTARDEAARAHVPGRDWAKTVVCIADDLPILAVVPAPYVIDLSKLAALAAVRHIRLATEQELEQLYPDCEIGATPPLGPLYGQRVFVERRLAQEADIVFAGGTHTDAVQMPFVAFLAVTHPVIGDFGELPGLASTASRDLWS